MTFALPTANNLHNVNRSANTMFLADINTPSNTGTKTAGSLPITDVAGEWDNNTNGAIKGVAYQFQATQASWDVSVDTKVMLWHSQFNAPNRMQVDSVANGGTRLRVYSGTGILPVNYKEYYLGGNDTPWGESVKGQVPFVIDLNDTSQEATAGTFDNTAVTSYAYLTLRLNLAGTSTGWNYMGKIYVVDTTKTSSSTPTFTATSNFQNAVDLIQGTDYTDKLGNWVRKIGSVIFMDMPFRIGDNSVQTIFNDQGVTVVSPVSDDANDPKNRLTTQAMRTYLNLRNSSLDTATFSGTWIWGTRAPFDWNQANAAVVTFNSPTFNGMGQFTVGSSVTGPATWDNVDPVVLGSTGADVDGSTFKNQNGNHALEMTAGAMNIANMRFENYAIKHAILIDTAGTYNLSNVYFDQSGTNDIETTHSSGVVTLNISNGGVTPTVTVTGAGTVVVNNNVTISVTVNDPSGSPVTGARVHVIATETVGTITTGDILLTGLTDASGVLQTTTFNYEAAFDPSGLDISFKVRKATTSPLYKPLDRTGVIVSGGYTTTVRMASDE